MKRVFFGLVAMLLSATVLAQPAHAYCSSVGSLQVCAGFAVSGPYQIGGTGPYRFDLYVTNLASLGVSHKIFSAGFAYNGSTAGWSLVGAMMNGTDNVLGGGGWNLKTNIPNNGVGNLLEVYAEGGGSAAVMPNGFIVLTFSTGTQQIAQGNFELYGWHSGAVNGTDCSLWLATDGTVVGENSTGCSSVVPEPISMALLGTGLAGLGGFGALRRRRKGLDVENA